MLQLYPEMKGPIKQTNKVSSAYCFEKSHHFWADFNDFSTAAGTGMLCLSWTDDISVLNQFPADRERIAICLIVPLLQTSRRHFWRKNIGNTTISWVQRRQTGLQPSVLSESTMSCVQTSPHNSGLECTTTASVSSHLTHFMCRSHGFIPALVLNFCQRRFLGELAQQHTMHNVTPLSLFLPTDQPLSTGQEPLAPSSNSVNSMRTHCFHKDRMQSVAKQPTQIFKACLFLHTV